MAKRILCILLSFTMVFTALAFSAPNNTASAATKTELEDKIDEIDDKIAANKKKLDELKNKKESQKEYLDTLEEQIEAVESKAINLQTQVSVVDEEISALNKLLKQLGSEITILEEEIAKIEKKITQTKNNIEETSDLLAQQIRAAYMGSNESTLKILSGADSLASFLTRLEMMKRTSENQKQVIDDFKAKVTELRAQEKELEEDKKSYDDKKTELELKKDEKVEKKSELLTKQAEYKKTMNSLESKYDEIEKYIESLDKTGNAYQSYIKELESERQAADAEIDKILSQYYATSNSQSTTLAGNNANPTTTTKPAGAGGNYTSNASWGWPLGNASCYISSGYGYRSASISGNSFHGGIDIAGGGITGKPVYASRAGKVITAITSNSGYGIHVLIDHGDGYSSLYAHMSVRYVNAGDTISKGQMIGRVGSTGNVTGPHLHFEVRYYGEKKNPANYVKKP